MLAEMTLNIKKTHSERLMPLLDSILTESAVDREQIDAIAVAAGPGSFTGLRIGLATARGLAQGLGIPAVPVCTLEALADAVPTPGTLICPLLDARRNQVYAALYRRKMQPPYSLQTLVEPAALALPELIANLAHYQEKIVFLGEGLHSYRAAILEALPAEAVITAAPYRLCRATLVALRGKSLLVANPQSSYRELLPRYLRRPQAERLAQEKEEGKERFGFSSPISSPVDPEIDIRKGNKR